MVGGSPSRWLARTARTLAGILVTSCGVLAQDSVPSPLSLDEAVRLALERNPRLQSARLSVDMSNADRVTARTLRNPVVTFDSVGRPPGTTPLVDDHEYVVRAEQELEFGGRRRHRVAAADAAAQATTHGAEDERRRLVLDVRKAYFLVVLARADLEVAQSTLTEMEQVTALNQARLAQGEISGTELRRTQVERLRFVDDVFASEITLLNARAALLALLGVRDLSQPVEVTDTLTITPAAMALAPDARLGLESMRQQAVANRPDLRAAADRTLAAQAEERLEHAFRLPTVTVGSGYSHLNGLNTVALSLAVSLPVFNRNAGGIARASAAALRAESERASLATAIALDVQQAANTVDVSRLRVAAIERDFLTPAREVRDIMVASYRLGDADLIDLLDAQRSYRDVQRAYNRALFDRQVSLIELASAISAPENRP